jgi:broad specificity phosphatase PhoE
MRTVLLVVLLGVALAATEALAAPRRVILLRHGEKADSYALTPTGQERAKALAAQFLGHDAVSSLFAHGERPAAFLSMTLHTIELIAPASTSWGMPSTSWLAVPDANDETDTPNFNARTREAARTLFKTRAWNGKTVVICWEHHHIADDELEAQFPGERVTWRQLLRLDRLPSPYREQVPRKWEGKNFDYFWIITFDRAGRPKTFESRLQDFTAPYDAVPANLWGEPEPE